MIEVNKLGKLYRIPYERREPTFFEEIKGFFYPPKYRSMWALRDINFKVNRGEFIGIIGDNGSGKTTLLKIIANVLLPTEGCVKSTGRIVPFLELGLGFHEDLTGRENVYLYSLIMGLNKREIDGKVEDIVRFSGLERFFDARLSTYSSGMKIRLAFSTAIQSNPDILLVDEVLSVGDVKFQEKCFKIFRKFKEDQKTILFVSHDLNAVRKFCNKVLWLNKGKQVILGDPDYVINKYLLNDNGEV